MSKPIYRSQETSKRSATIRKTHGFTFKTDDNSRDFTRRFLLLLSTISLCSAEQRIFLKIQRTHRRRSTAVLTAETLGITQTCNYPGLVKNPTNIFIRIG